jgi:hypothetical protein
MAELNHAMEVRLALAHYAYEHEGSFPARLSDLPPESISPEARQFHHPRTQKAQDWIYFPDHRQEQRSRHIILASPVSLTREGKRIVVFADMSGGLISEEEFTRRAAGQSVAP